MGKVVLISGDPKTHDEITALLPKGASLEEFATLEQLPRSAVPGEGGRTDTVILVDLSGAPPSAGRLESFHAAGVPLVALIASPAQRESALRAGFDDYLLHPVSAAELKIRLQRLPLPGAVAQTPSAVIERERQAAVGRLTSYFCHAVNNSMQTIRGAIDLAREEPDLPAGVDEYLAICRKETANIGAKIERLRQIYRPKPSPPEAIALGTLLHESLAMATDDLLRNEVSAREQFDSPLPAIHGSADRLYLAFLMMIFHISQELGGQGGGELRVQAARDRGCVLATLSAVPGSNPAGGEATASDSLPPGLEPARELILSERGQVQRFRRDGGFCLQVRFPAGGS